MYISNSEVIIPINKVVKIKSPCANQIIRKLSEFL